MPDVTGADALMIGRAARAGRGCSAKSGIFLAHRHAPDAPASREIHEILMAHLEDLYDFYGTETGVRVARKHISWYTQGLVGSAAFRHPMNQLPDIEFCSNGAQSMISSLPLAENNEHLELPHGDDNEPTTTVPGTLHEKQRHRRVHPGRAENLFRRPGWRAAGVITTWCSKRRTPDARVVLRQAGGNQTLAAEMLGINRNTLRKKLVDTASLGRGELAHRGFRASAAVRFLTARRNPIFCDPEKDPS